MLNRLPRQLPPLSLMLEDIGRPKPAELARRLGVGERTVKRWIRDDAAPLPVLLALFWVTRWGASVVDCEAHNQAVMQAALARSLKTENAALRARLRRLGRIADFGAANDPAPDVEVSPQPVEPPDAPPERPREPATASGTTAGSTGTTDGATAGSTEENRQFAKASRRTVE